MKTLLFLFLLLISGNVPDAAANAGAEKAMEQWVLRCLDDAACYQQELPAELSDYTVREPDEEGRYYGSVLSLHGPGTQADFDVYLNTKTRKLSYYFDDDEASLLEKSEEELARLFRVYNISAAWQAQLKADLSGTLAMSGMLGEYPCAWAFSTSQGKEYYFNDRHLYLELNGNIIELVTHEKTHSENLADTELTFALPDIFTEVTEDGNLFEKCWTTETEGFSTCCKICVSNLDAASQAPALLLGQNGLSVYTIETAEETVDGKPYVTETYRMQDDGIQMKFYYAGYSDAFSASVVEYIVPQLPPEVLANL